MKHSVVCSALLILTALLMAACSQAASTQGPSTWIDEPLDGAQLPLGPQELMAHASDADGVANLEFRVNGALLVRSPAGGGVLGDATVGWDPSAPGVYTITAIATDSRGNTGPDATAVVTVGEAEASPTPWSTEEIVSQETPSQPPSSPIPSGTRMPPTPTPPFPTATPRPPTPTPPFPTAGPRSPTATPQPPPRRPEIAYFEANPSSINAGGCSTIRWGVDYAAAIYLDGEGVYDHDEWQVCPPTTTTYTLFATSGGGEDTRSVEVTVIQAPTPTSIPTSTPMEDNAPPSISNISLSANTISTFAGCSNPPSTTTITARVRDESGVWAVIASLQLAGSPAGTVVMGQSAPDVYQAELGPFTQIGDLVVAIMAQDYHANTAEAVRTVAVSGMCIE